MRLVTDEPRSRALDLDGLAAPALVVRLRDLLRVAVRVVAVQSRRVVVVVIVASATCRQTQQRSHRGCACRDLEIHGSPLP